MKARRWFEAVYLVSFNYIVFAIFLSLIVWYFSEKDFDKIISSGTGRAKWALILFDSGYGLTIHLLWMPLMLLLGYYFLYKLKPGRPLLFYLLYIAGLTIFYLITFCFGVFIQGTLIEKIFPDPFHIYEEAFNKPYKLFLLIPYHAILDSFFSIWFYHFLLKKVNRETHLKTNSYGAKPSA
ncbi:MAG: hypothetical protein M3Q97_01640 [Bacteroidota bacterium]|nr:hypothetical protein [Bacteroidota bacterium]